MTKLNKKQMDIILEAKNLGYGATEALLKTMPDKFVIKLFVKTQKQKEINLLFKEYDKLGKEKKLKLLMKACDKHKKLKTPDYIKEKYEDK